MNPRFGYLTVLVAMLVALVLAACSTTGVHGAACSAFFWSLAGLGAAFALDFAMDSGNRSRMGKA